MGCCGSRDGKMVPKYEIPDGESFTLLPGRLREKIWRLLDQHSKVNVRTLCRAFKEDIDTGSGLTVTVDDLKEGNLNFVKSVEASGAEFMHLSDSFFEQQGGDGRPAELFRCHWNLNSLEIWGHLSRAITENIVLKCSFTLTDLTFKPLALMTKVVNPSPSSPLQPGLYEFPSLRTLTFHYGFFDTPDQNFKVFNENMRFILRTFSCLRLRILRVIPEPSVVRALLEEGKRIEHVHVRWESSALKGFIEHHRVTLREVDLCLLRTHTSPEEKVYKSPRNLYEYSVVAPCIEGIMPLSLTHNYWQRSLYKQASLFKLTAQVELWGSFDCLYDNLRKSVFPTNYHSLHEVWIISYHRKLSPEPTAYVTDVDFGLFGRCDHLAILHVKVLHVQAEGERDVFLAAGLADMPQSLKELEITGVTCLSDDLLHVVSFPKLRRVTLRDVGQYGPHGTTFTVARAMFVNRRMEMVRLDGYNDGGESRRLIALIRKFNGRYDNFIEVTNPSTKIPCVDWMPLCCVLHMV